ncbi:MAG: PAS domain-containing protein [Chlorobiaceae bacterium]|nr:PAS domain-containing protein [Chlorobiaceae bacterium]
MNNHCEASWHDIVLPEHRAAFAEPKVQALRTALEAARVGYWEWNLETGLVRIDRQWADLTGYHPEELTPFSIDQWKELCHPEDIDVAFTSLEEHIHGNPDFFELVIRVRHKTGTWVRVIDRGKTLGYDSQGRPSRVVGSRQPFETERGMQNSKTKQKNSERELQSLIDNIPGSVYHIDASGLTTVLSRSTELLLSSDPGSHEPQFIDMISMVHPDDRQKVNASYRILKEKKHSLTLIYRLLTPQNNFLWVEDHKTSTFTDEGQYAGIDGILYDISERIASQEETRRLESQLRKSQRLETIGTLAGGIAHDFNNILTPILGYSEMGLATITEDDPLHDYLTEIMQAAERAQKLVAQILTFSRAQDGKPAPVNIQSIIIEAIKLLRPSLPSTISIEQGIDQSCRNVLADPSQIHQVIVNLCTNAFHAMEHTGGTLRIDLKEVHQESDRTLAMLKLPETSYAELTVSDTGTGMDDITMERVFEPFFTTKSIDKGTGLGLSVVHGIVTGANGQITVESVKAKGSSFHVYLPLIDENHPTEPIEKLRFITSTGSVLFVDDEPAAVHMMTIMMTKLGFSIKAEQSPIAALKLFRDHPGAYDLVITDLTMPEMTGLQLAAELRKISPETPVILMTGYGKIIDHDTPLSHFGISRLLKKPVKLVQLAATINEVLSATNLSKTT